MKVKPCIAAVILGLVQGCAVFGERANQAPAGPTTVVDKLVQFKAERTGGLYRLLHGSSSGVADFAGMPAYEQVWCVPADMDFARVTRNMLGSYCQDVGGQYDGEWCRVARDSGPLFRAVVGPGTMVERPARGERLCSTGSALGVIAVTGEGMNPTQWDEVARSRLNYKSEAQLERDKYAEEVAKQAMAVAEMTDRVSRSEEVMRAGVGAQVCSKGNNSLTYIGYVERVENGRVKVTVSDARLGNSTLRPGGFETSVLWDSPLNWYLCSYR